MWQYLQVTSQLFDMLSDNSTVDHPLCEECTDTLLQVTCTMYRWCNVLYLYSRPPSVWGVYWYLALGTVLYSTSHWVCVCIIQYLYIWSPCVGGVYNLYISWLNYISFSYSPWNSNLSWQSRTASSTRWGTAAGAGLQVGAVVEVGAGVGSSGKAEAWKFSWNSQKIMSNEGFTAGMVTWNSKFGGPECPGMKYKCDNPMQLSFLGHRIQCNI